MDPRRRTLGALAVALSVAGCGATADDDDVDPRVDAAPPGDARPITCDNSPPAWVGRCEIAGTGEHCTGVPGEERVFVELGTSDDMYMVLGPQGARMFVLAVRTQDIYPGDPDEPASPDNPEVDLRLGRADVGTEIARYRGRPLFSPGDPGMLDAAGLFVIIDGTGGTLVGEQLLVGAEVVDRDGEFRCGTATFRAMGP